MIVGSGLGTDKPYLLRAWGGALDEIVALLKPHGSERADQGVVCWWFATKEERDLVIGQLRTMGRCAFASADHGLDEDGEFIDVTNETYAVVTLQLPDGREFSYRQSFGYAYPASAVEFMYGDGNYGCDCNRALFLHRHCGVDLAEFGEEPECGERIKLVSLTVVKGEPS